MGGFQPPPPGMFPPVPGHPPPQNTYGHFPPPQVPGIPAGNPGGMQQYMGQPTQFPPPQQYSQNPLPPVGHHMVPPAPMGQPLLMNQQLPPNPYQTMPTGQLAVAPPTQQQVSGQDQLIN